MNYRIGWFVGLLLGLVITPVVTGDGGEKKDAKPAKVRPYNEKADAAADIQAALGHAKKENRRVLIQWGGNWCSWCVLLHECFTTDAELRRKLLYEYEVVHIAVGQGDKNLDLAKRYHAIQGQGVPYLTILDADGKVLINQRSDPFETKDQDGKKGHDPKKLLAFLTEHQAKPQIAEEVLAAARREAEKTDRLVFLHFGAPWCGWCHRLEHWLARPEVAATLSKDFVEVKIDIDRTEGGKALLKRYNTNGSGGIPWFAFIDGKDKVLAASDGPRGNIGFPYEEAEIEHFLKMLETSKPRLTRKDLEGLHAALKAERKPRK
jgi:thioredoxin-related protein